VTRGARVVDQSVAEGEARKQPVTFANEGAPERQRIGSTERAPATLIASVQRALHLMEAVCDHEHGAPVKVLAREAGLHLGTAYHLLRTLVYEGYLYRLADGSYVLSDRLSILLSQSQLHVVPSRAGTSRPEHRPWELQINALPSEYAGCPAPPGGVSTRECVMALTSARLQRMSLDTPEEVRPFEEGKGKLELVNLAGGPVGRATFEPGWQWSKHIKPIAKTDSCQAAHVGYFISGRMKVVMDDGAEEEFGPGDLMICPPGHDAWIVGDEACVVIDWQGFADYAKR
jgi:quercetin dioxygenase-like cupin family protein